MDGYCACHGNDLEVTFVLVVMTSIGKAQGGVCQTADAGKNAPRFDIILFDEFFDGVEEVVSGFEAEGVGFHNERG